MAQKDKGPQRETKKAKGAIKTARKKHLARQAVRDALGKLRNGETVWIKVADGSSTRAVQVRPFEAGEPVWLQKVIALAGRRIQLGNRIDKDGYTFASARNTYPVGPEHFYGVVIYDPDVDRPGEGDPTGMREAEPVYRYLRTATPGEAERAPGTTQGTQS